MATLLAGLPVSVPGTTLNRLCGSGMDAVLAASRIIRSGEAELVLAGGVESMSRAPFVMPKADTAFSRNAEIYDTTIGWRFVNPVLKSQYGVDSMPETGENVAEDFGISREDQDAFALRSQTRAGKAQASGRLAKEIVAVEIPRRKGTRSLSTPTSIHARIPRSNSWPSSRPRSAPAARSQRATRPASMTARQD
jgi:acetyl-CoA acyltransferase